MESDLKMINRIIIDVYEKNRFCINLVGEPDNELTCLGSIKYAENWLMDRINKQFGICENNNGKINLQKGEQTCDKNVDGIISLNKREAIDTYLDVLVRVKKRLKAIQECENDNQIFDIDKDKLDNI